MFTHAYLMSAHPQRRPVERQKLDRLRGLTFVDKIGQHFAERRRELEAMAGKARADHHVVVLRMPVDDEMAIGRFGVHAHGMRRGPHSQAGQKTLVIRDFIAPGGTFISRRL